MYVSDIKALSSFKVKMNIIKISNLPILIDHVYVLCNYFDIAGANLSVPNRMCIRVAGKPILKVVLKKHDSHTHRFPFLSWCFAAL